jgi:hypothetical protein
MMWHSVWRAGVGRCFFCGESGVGADACDACLPLVERFSDANPSKSMNALVDQEMLVFAELPCAVCGSADGEVGVSSGSEPLTWRNLFIVCRGCADTWDRDARVDGATWARRDAWMDRYPAGPDIAEVHHDMADSKAELLMDNPDIYPGMGPSAAIRDFVTTALGEVMSNEHVERVTPYWFDVHVGHAVDHQRYSIAEIINDATAAVVIPTREPLPTTDIDVDEDTFRIHVKAVAAWQKRQPPIPKRDWTTDEPFGDQGTPPEEPGILVLRDKQLDIVRVEACNNINAAVRRLASTDFTKNPFAWDLMVGVPLASESAMRQKVRARFKTEGITIDWIETDLLDGIAESIQKELHNGGYDIDVVTT